MATYQLAQAEAQALMDWVKKFAKAFMEGDD
jgi:CRISPR-associated protein Cmr5